MIRRDEIRPVIILVTVYSAALAVWGAYPLMAGMYAEYFHLSLSQIGWALAAEQFGGVAGAILAVWLVTRVSGRTLISASCGIAAVANILTGLAGGYLPLLMLRFVSGAGMLLAANVCVYALARSSDPSRALGAALLLNILTNVADVWVVEQAQRSFGYVGGLSSAAPWFLLCIGTALFLRGDRHGAHAGRTAAKGDAIASRGVAMCALLALVLWGISNNGLWGFVERIATAHGLSRTEISWGLSIGMLGGVPGALYTTVAGARGGLARMLVVATAAYVLSLLLLGMGHSEGAFAAALVIYTSAWNMGNAYYWTTTTIYDTNGGFTRVMYLGTVLSTALGPLLAGLVASRGGLGALLWAAPVPAVLALVVLITAIVLARGSHRQSSSQAAFPQR
jgi:predicted MFS family arabinose efflux permease